MRSGPFLPVLQEMPQDPGRLSLPQPSPIAAANSHVRSLCSFRVDRPEALACGRKGREQIGDLSRNPVKLAAACCCIMYSEAGSCTHGCPVLHGKPEMFHLMCVHRCTDLKNASKPLGLNSYRTFWPTRPLCFGILWAFGWTPPPTTRIIKKAISNRLLASRPSKQLVSLAHL